MKATTLFILSVLIAFSCQQEDVGSLTGPIQIRILNATPYDLKSITVNTSGGVNSYDELKPLTYSSYKAFDFAYPYAFISVHINDKQFTLQPIDYFGETQYVTGKFTYALHIEDFEKGILSVEWIRN